MFSAAVITVSLIVSLSPFGWLNRHSDHGARLKIYRMLGFMSQMRAAIFHLGNARIGIVGMGPVVIRSFLWPFAIQARQIFSPRRFDTPPPAKSPDKKDMS
jgi:hypothetical protein